MKKINVIIPTGEKIEADLVRYFEAYGKKYLVYTLNEKDEQGFIKLYVARVEDATGATGTQKVLTGNFVEDDNEWKAVKDEFKKIISENSDGVTKVNDLNPNGLNGINVKGHRVIKLMESYVNLLSANQREFAEETKAQSEMFSMPQNFEFDYQKPSSFPETSFGQETKTKDFGYQAPSFDFNPQPSYQNNTYEAPSYSAPAMEPVKSNNYEEMYNELKAKFDRINTELEKVTNENIELRIKIDDIREILNEN